MSASGAKPDMALTCQNVRYWPLADISSEPLDVRFQRQIGRSLRKIGHQKMTGNDPKQTFQLFLWIISFWIQIQHCRRGYRVE